MNATLWCRRSASLSFSVGSARAPGGPGHPGSRGDAVQAGGGSRHPACPSGSPGRAEPPVISRAMPRSTRASIALLAVGKLRPLNSLSCLGLVSGRWRRACREPASANGGSGRILPGPPAHSREWLFPPNKTPYQLCGSGGHPALDSNFPSEGREMDRVTVRSSFAQIIESA